MGEKALLALADGTYFEGKAFGYIGRAEGEVCFNTSMTGYQEILTDPSYSGQMVCMTYPEIGNYGVNPEDVESKKIHATGFIVKNACKTPSNYRNGIMADSKPMTISDYLKREKIPGIEGIDTRKLVRVLRDKGSQPGILISGDYDKEKILAEVSKVPNMNGQNLAFKVTTDAQFDYSESESDIAFTPLNPLTEGARIAVMDFGAKNNILRKLTSLGAHCHVFPASASAEEIKAFNPDGVMLSNGPGDPEPCTQAIETIQELLPLYPIFGICLGHQLLSLALGGKTYKLKFGHRGANHPIKHLPTGTVAITSQNHGFAVSAESLEGKDVEITHINLNDNTVAGIKHKKYPAFSVQYHPEASPGPRDAENLFKEFIANVNEYMKQRETV